ncbi:GTPase domain-containing protein [Pyxidicoccus parkwayensis]|uniref:GTPase domain-containing protein n=1 Tax=Pyxidicoccus parkwayensis TaxID=2813578 RepID=A0ABX7NVA6_9BACT|nr:GTPase domain-containing protein [Pyxidicoccus parkwaysis]QSQ22284.1 GTPase domain-containing protein [Pyxidicoccus parkwaysis]
MRDPYTLRTSLASALDALPAPERFPEAPDADAARRLAERLRRDLLPRLGSADAPLLLVAIAGPNNVGKSTLFNALVGAALSPARPEGGLTKQCLAAAHPETWTGALKDFLTRRYDTVPVPSGDMAPVDQPGPAGRLYLVLSDAVPRGLLVMDTPDFDSVYRDNRERAEALLVTVDALVFVVSRQTYQNAALVDFLRAAVGHGRPYLLVYNEATREEVARGHLDKLASDVGHPPLARYLAPHQPEVEAGLKPLATEPLDGKPPLSALLGQAEHARELKARALEASLADARAELDVVAKAAARAAQEPERLRQRLRHELNGVGAAAALKAVPADVLIDAFRDELDARSQFHKWVRLPFRGLATALTFVSRKVRQSFTGPEPEGAEPPTLAVDESMKDGVRKLVDAMATEVAAWRGDAQTRAKLAEAFGPVTLAKLEEPLGFEPLHAHAADRATLYTYCRDLVATELQGGMREELLQTLTTLVYSVPSGAAAVVTVATGGFGHDAVVWAGTLLSTPLLERFVDLLGAQVRARVTRKWADSHGATLAKALEARFFSSVLGHLDGLADDWTRTAARLEETRAKLT